MTGSDVESRRSDLIILGAGPAGCAAAISAALADLRVTVLTIAAKTRLHPGETLHPGVEPIFRQLGIWDSVLQCGFHRHRGIWRESESGERTFDPYGRDKSGPWLGFQVDRAQLDQILRARVTDLGGKIETVSRLDCLLPHDSAIAGVSAGPRTFHAPFVLDASGRHSWLAAKLDLIAERINETQRLRFGWTADTMPELEGQPLFRQRRDGWDWRAPLGDGRCAWAKLRNTSDATGVDYSWRIYRDCAGDGYFLLGDAACLMDPSTANGVLRAVMSGIYAVHLITAIEKGATSRPDAAVEYKRWTGEMFDRALTLWRTTLSHLTEAS